MAVMEKWFEHSVIDGTPEWRVLHPDHTFNKDEEMEWLSSQGFNCTFHEWLHVVDDLNTYIQAVGKGTTGSLNTARIGWIFRLTPK